MSEKRNVWLTSDYHLLHVNIIKLCTRLFANEYSMSEAIIKKHNIIVKKNDLVLHLGDLSFGVNGREDQLKYYLKKLNGTKILIRGNHDEYDDSFYIKLGFSAVYDYLEIGDYFINHYPLEFETVKSKYIKTKEREIGHIFQKSKCTKIIHGHHHTHQFNDDIRYNVSSDLHDFYPVHIDKITKSLNP